MGDDDAGIVRLVGEGDGTTPSILSDRLSAVLDRVEDSGRAALLALQDFCLGDDTHMHDRMEIGEHRHLEVQIRRMESLPIVSVAHIDGLCIGASFELAVAADFRFATAEAGFKCPQVRNGYLPGLSVNRLPRLIGAGISRRLLLLGDTWGVIDAEEAGLIDGVLSADQLEEHVRELAAKLPQDEGVALQMCRRLIGEAQNTDYDAGRGHFMAAQNRCYDALDERK
jgi:enoyl-CoA hydratase/carnithine racemase